MEVILLDKVANLGNIGEKVKVRGGFGRNFLIPQGKAVPATAANLEAFNERKAEIEAASAERLVAAKARAEKLKELSIQISGKAGDEGKLFGSVGTRDIADAITEAGVEVSKSEVNLPDGPIRNIGDFEINLHLHSDVDVAVTVSVVAVN